MVVDHFAKVREGREAQLLRRGTPDRDRNELAAEIRTIDEILSWPRSRADTLYKQADKEEGTHGR